MTKKQEQKTLEHLLRAERMRGVVYVTSDGALGVEVSGSPSSLMDDVALGWVLMNLNLKPGQHVVVTREVREQLTVDAEFAFHEG